MANKPDTKPSTRILSPTGNGRPERRVELAKDLLLHVDNLFHQRINFFLVTQGILLAAFAKVLSKNEFLLVQILICCAGVISVVVFSYPIERLYIGYKWLRDRFKVLDTTELYSEYCDVGRGGQSANYLMAQMLPTATFVLWLLLLVIITYPWIKNHLM